MSEELLESISTGVSIEQEGASQSFGNGSIFAAPVEGDSGMLVRVEAGSSLTITTATYQDGKAGTATLQCMLNEDMGLLSLCHVGKGSTVTGLDLTVVGPQDLVLASPDACINVFGTVCATADRYIEPALMSSTDEEVIDQGVVEDLEMEESHANEDTQVSKKRRKMSEDENEQTPAQSLKEEAKSLQQEQDKTNGDEVPHLSKKQRRKLAKKKAKELSEAVAFLNKHGSKNETTVSKDDPSKKPAPLTKERRLPSGVLVKDYIIGAGAVVKPGRKVSIIYEGAFPTGKVFDRNKNRNKPLTFRQGTGEVIRGLEAGLEGMRVGGEREITIPPALGYGKKGSGNVVPPNSTLVFSVQLLSVGG